MPQIRSISSLSEILLDSAQFEDEDIPQIKEEVEKILSQRHPKSLVYMQDNTEDLVREKEIQETVARALYLLAMVALLIGGVGIANISIASVIERITIYSFIEPHSATISLRLIIV